LGTKFDRTEKIAIRQSEIVLAYLRDTISNQFLNANELLAKYSSSIFQIESEAGSGTGFLYSTQSQKSIAAYRKNGSLEAYDSSLNKYIVTNKHVWNSDCKELRITDVNGCGLVNSVSAKYCDDAADIAIFKVEHDQRVPFYAVDERFLLQKVVAIGFPWIANSSENVLVVQSGEVIGEFKSTQNEALIIISTPISPGNSGGPILNKEGRLVGVAVEEMQGQYSWNTNNTTADGRNIVRSSNHFCVIPFEVLDQAIQKMEATR
jgi:S1-C subfamily serine protease